MKTVLCSLLLLIAFQCDVTPAQMATEEFSTAAAKAAQTRYLAATKDAKSLYDRSIVKATQEYVASLQRAQSDAMRVGNLNEANGIQGTILRLDDGDDVVNVPSEVRRSLGRELLDGGKELYGGSIRLRAFERGIVVTDKAGNIFHALLEQPSPGTHTVGQIGKHFDRNGGSHNFGRPLQGEQLFFGGAYHSHVCERSVIVWRQRDHRVEVVELPKPFTVQVAE